MVLLGMDEEIFRNDNDAIELNEEITSIRVRYSTIVNYLSQIYRLIIAVGFTIVVTRRLTREEYGLFTTINSINLIILSIAFLWQLWVTRYYARRRYEYVSTALFLNTLFAPMAFLTVVTIGFYYSNLLGYDWFIFIVGALWVVIEVFNRFYRYIVMGSKPFIFGKTEIVRHSFRISFAYIFVALLAYRVMGAILSVIIASLAAFITYSFLISRYKIHIPRLKIDKEKIVTLIKNSYIPLQMSLYRMLLQFERPILVLLTASTLAAAYMGVAYIPRSVIIQSGRALSSGLVSKLLRKPSREDIEDVLRVTFIVNIGILFLLITLSIPLLSLFRIEYIDGRILFILFSFESIFLVLSNIFGDIAMAMERKDLYEAGLALIGTPLFRIPFYRLIRGICAIATGSVVSALMIYYFGITDPVIISMPYPTTWLITAIPLFIYTYKEARRQIEFKIPYRELIASVIAGSVASFFLYLTGSTNYIVKSFWQDTPYLLTLLAITAIIYFGIVLLLSKWLRDFIKKSIKHYLGKA